MPKNHDNLLPNVKPVTVVSLDDHDPSDTGSYESAEEAKETLQAHINELIKLQNLLYAENRRSLLIILQGMYTSGKDGKIRHVLSGLPPLGGQVHACKPPSPERWAN